MHLRVDSAGHAVVELCIQLGQLVAGDETGYSKKSHNLENVSHPLRYQIKFLTSEVRRTKE